jgi:hypothetical protein
MESNVNLAMEISKIFIFNEKDHHIIAHGIVPEKLFNLEHNLFYDVVNENFFVGPKETERFKNFKKSFVLCVDGSNRFEFLEDPNQLLKIAQLAFMRGNQTWFDREDYRNTKYVSEFCQVFGHGSAEITQFIDIICMYFDDVKNTITEFLKDKEYHPINLAPEFDFERYTYYYTSSIAEILEKENKDYQVFPPKYETLL